MIVVDNGGGDEIDDARARARVKVAGNGRNIGFAGGCNLGAEAARGDVLLFLNPDTVAAKGAVAALAEQVRDPSIGVAMPRLRLSRRPDLLNSGGNVVHVSGLAWAGRYEQPATTITEVEDVPYASGAALAVRAEVFEELGGFTSELFTYQEDLELCWRARLRGLRVVITPAADVYHDYDFERNEAKRYFLERNRLIFVLTAYPLRLLLAAAPVLVGVELGIVGLSIVERWFAAKARSWVWIAGHPRWLVRHRRETMRLSRVPTRKLVRFLTPVVDPKMIGVPRLVGVVNALNAGYWHVVEKLL